ncbi:hypothetical protein M405DRAFT_822664, partial [Rhizopogon salebrosus TDB-379]
DVPCLVVQALGGASSAHSGGNIMLGGIAAQLFAVMVYVALAVECFLRFKHNAPFRQVDTSEKSQRYVSKNLKVKLFGMGFCTLCVFIRSVYRTIELANGWSGPIISTERYFVWLNVADPTGHTSQQAADEEA